MGSKKCNLEIFSLNFFTCSQLSHKHIANNLKRFKKNLRVAFHVLKKKTENARKLTKRDKNYIKSRNATIKLSQTVLNFYQCVCVKIGKV